MIRETHKYNSMLVLISGTWVCVCFFKQIFKSATISMSRNLIGISNRVKYPSFWLEYFEVKVLE